MMFIILLLIPGAFMVTLALLREKENRDYRELRSRFRYETAKEIPPRANIDRDCE
jgi:hypothetical protein